MNALLLACALVLPGTVDRDHFGVPKITAPTFEEAFYLFGKTVAEDRLWQMENSRHVARGRSAEIIGQTAVAADKETLQTGYTDSEYAEMFGSMPAKAKSAFTEYARGVNDTIKARRVAGTIPSGYKEAGIEPEEWTVTDSMAIEVMLSRRFGTGGAGELRDLALYLYLKSQPCKDKALDVVDDLAWQNDPASIPTVRPEEDPLATDHPSFPAFTRKETEDQLAAMPKVSLFELIPAVRAANGDESRLIAESVQAPHETGSYCMVVSPSRSATGRALLLTGPQMGHSMPSIVHEVALDTPGFKVAGIDVPGIPAVVIGNTPHFAWGLTTGVADIADIVYAFKVGDAQYVHGSETRAIQRLKQEIKVKGHEPVTFEYARTDDGPVILESRSNNCIFSQRMSYWKQEAQSWSCLYDLYSARSAADIEKGVNGIAMNMNFFFATKEGDTGWRYLGKMPIRSQGYDPRFPIPSKPETDWKGFLKPESMPHVRNPQSGLIANWNNKPASWWPNMDTPAWGAIFRNEVLLQSLSKEKLSPFDLEKAAWDIARKDTDSNSAFGPLLKSSVTGDEAKTLLGTTISSYDGWVVQGAESALLYRTAVTELRKELFGIHTGNFTSDSLFERVVQPSVMAKALAGTSHYDYLAGRKKEELALKALRHAFESLSAKYGPEPAMWPTNIGAIGTANGPPVYYSNRGTYIQVTELGAVPVGRSVAAPGVTESGPNSDDQVDLARQWVFKPMWRLSEPEAK